MSHAVPAGNSFHPTPANSVHDLAREGRGFYHVINSLRMCITGLKIRVSTVQFRPPAPDFALRATPGRPPFKAARSLSIYADLGFSERPPKYPPNTPSVSQTVPARISPYPTQTDSSQNGGKFKRKDKAVVGEEILGHIPRREKSLYRIGCHTGM